MLFTLLLTALAMGRARLLLYYPWFYFGFVGDQTQTSARPNRQRDGNHAARDAYSININLLKVESEKQLISDFSKMQLNYNNAVLIRTISCSGCAEQNQSDKAIINSLRQALK